MKLWFKKSKTITKDQFIKRVQEIKKTISKPKKKIVLSTKKKS